MNVYVYKLFEISKNQVIVLVKGKLPPFHMTGVLSFETRLSSLEMRLSSCKMKVSSLARGLKTVSNQTVSLESLWN